MKIIYIKQEQDTCDFIKRIIIIIKKFLNIIKVEDTNNKTIYCLPLFKDSKVSKSRTRKLSNKINKLLEKEGSNNIVLSEYLDNNQLFKNYLYSENINILNGRYLFKCLVLKILRYIFKMKNQAMEFRRGFIAN